MYGIAVKLHKRLGMDGVAPAGSTISTVLRHARHSTQRGRTLFIHFDEASALSKEVMKGLRDDICCALFDVHDQYTRDKNTPRVHFYITGRGGSLLAIDLTCIGIKRIVLTQLQPEHVGAIRETLTTDGGLDLHVRAPL